MIIFKYVSIYVDVYLYICIYHPHAAACRQGLPIRVHVANGPNDPSHQFLKTGEFKPRAVSVSAAPAMDIGVPYNFQRYLYYLCGESSETLREWMHRFNSSGGLTLPRGLSSCMQRDMLSTRCSDAEVRETIRSYYSRNGYVVDPHTAVGVHGALQLAKGGAWPSVSRCVVLATAGPHKFADLVEPEIGRKLDPHPNIEPLKGMKNIAISVKLDCAGIIKEKFRTVRENMLKN